MATTEPCHCGRPVHVYMDGFTRNMCEECSSVRCDTADGMPCPVTARDDHAAPAAHGGLEFASIGPAGITHYARCEPCMYGSCPGGWHSWAGPEDVEHAAKTGQVHPGAKRCACDCATGPVIEQDGPDIELESLTVEPCPLCGAAGACAYDAEGRPMIHTDADGVE